MLSYGHWRASKNSLQAKRQSRALEFFNNSKERKFSNSLQSKAAKPSALILDFYTSQEWIEFENYFFSLRASMFNSLILINSIERKFSNSLILDFYTSQEWIELKNYFFCFAHFMFNSLILNNS